MVEDQASPHIRGPLLSSQPDSRTLHLECGGGFPEQGRGLPSQVEDELDVPSPVFQEVGFPVSDIFSTGVNTKCRTYCTGGTDLRSLGDVGREISIPIFPLAASYQSDCEAALGAPPGHHDSSLVGQAAMVYQPSPALQGEGLPLSPLG